VGRRPGRSLRSHYNSRFVEHAGGNDNFTLNIANDHRAASNGNTYPTDRNRNADGEREPPTDHPAGAQRTGYL
jgi:hypothetical protein